MIELDGRIEKIDLPHYVEGTRLFGRDKLYYLVYAAIARPVGSEQVAYETAEKITAHGRTAGSLRARRRNSFTIYRGVIEFRGQWYFFYHYAGLTLNGEKGRLGRRAYEWNT